MRFLWPYMLWLLWLPPILTAAYFYALARRKKAAIRFASLAIAKEAIRPGHRLRRHVPPLLFLLSLIVAILACARPTASVVLPTERMTVVLAMDVSRSMQAADVEPTRISAAQDAARSFIAQLPSSVRLGIVSFAGTAAVVQTPTENRQDMLDAIDRFQLQRGTATGSGLILSLAMLFPEDGIDLEQFLFANPYSSRSRRLPGEAAKPDAPKKKERPPVPAGSYTDGTIILLSDGRRTTGPDPLEAARMAAERGVRVYTVGFGTSRGAPIGDEGWSYFARIDDVTLKAVAQMTGGEYFQAGSMTDLSKVYEKLNVKFALERQETEISALFSIVSALLLLAAALLSLAWFHRGR